MITKEGRSREDLGDFFFWPTQFALDRLRRKAPSARRNNDKGTRGFTQMKKKK